VPLSGERFVEISVVHSNVVTIPTSEGYSLASTCAPVAWGGGRWPNQEWIDGRLVYLSQDSRGTILREVRPGPDGLELTSDRFDIDHPAWARRVLAADRVARHIPDSTINGIAARNRGMRPYSNETLFDGVVTAIIGQSISVQAAAVTERKLAALFVRPVELYGRTFWPMPTREQLANADPLLVRQSGVTQRRADAIVAIARKFVAGEINEPAPNEPEAEIYARVLALPQVGRWTAESVMLWGLGSDDSYPIGDVALLRAARLAYGQPEMTHRDMDRLSDGWSPARSWAARWLWLNLFGPAPD
jgi:3-methyladenine DNA glycosylase/8-oxoguanine DNA glycosylase